MDNVIDVFHTDLIRPSIDKLSIFGHSKRDIINIDFDAIIFWKKLNQFSVKHTTCVLPNHFRELWAISYLHYYPNGTAEKYTIAILIGWNGVNNCLTQENQRRFKIEYNPNKFIVPDWLLDVFVKKQFVVDYVKNIDLAFDFFGYPKRWFHLFPDSGNTTIASIGTLNNKTDYIGFSDKSANRIKIYDKKIERKKFETLDLETTRVEITLDFSYEQKGISFTKDSNALVSSAFALSQVSVEFSDSNDPFVFALSCLDKSDLDCAFKLMSKHTRKKYKDILSSFVSRRLFCDWFDLFSFLDKSISDILHSLSIDFLFDLVL